MSQVLQQKTCIHPYIHRVRLIETEEFSYFWGRSESNRIESSPEADKTRKPKTVFVIILHSNYICIITFAEPNKYKNNYFNYFEVSEQRIGRSEKRWTDRWINKVQMRESCGKKRGLIAIWPAQGLRCKMNTVISFSTTAHAEIRDICTIRMLFHVLSCWLTSQYSKGFL